MTQQPKSNRLIHYGYFIMQLWQTGNVGSHNISKFKGNPEFGYITEYAAWEALLWFQKNDNWEVNSEIYEFSVMRICSIEKIKP